MTNNDIFLKLCQLTGLSVDYPTLEKIMGKRGIVMTKTQFNHYRRTEKQIALPAHILSEFIQALFDLRKEADDAGLVIFDCRNIFDEINESKNKDKI